MTTGDRFILVTLVGVATIVALRLLSDPPAPDPAIEKTADSLDRARPALDSALAASDSIARDRARAQQELERLERARRAAADRQRRLADSLAAIATHAVDSAAAWRAAYDARTAEADSLRGELSAKDRRVALLEADTTRLSDDKRALLDRNAALEQFNADLRVAIKKANECTIVWKIRCPSRTETAIGTGLLTYAAAR